MHILNFDFILSIKCILFMNNFFKLFILNVNHSFFFVTTQISILKYDKENEFRKYI